MAETISLNLRGQICPDPLVQVQDALKRAAAGDVLEVAVDYPLAVENISRWAEGQGHAVAVTQKEGEWEIRITLA
ncbi:MAG: sulfurtransferase TusA family protein [bacterium]